MDVRVQTQHGHKFYRSFVKLL